MNVSTSALVTFLLYSAAVFGIAWASHRLQKKKSFLGEYFLGSRGLGVLALALTYGATSASAGSFAGFPSLIYSHGWVLALWIASYMIFPLCGMGLLGKRLNRFSRETGAITLPDVLRVRFSGQAPALLSTALMALLLTVYLIPQFTLASLIINQLLGQSQFYLGLVSKLGEAMRVWGWSALDPAYVAGLLLFAVLVVLYTTFGGFRAVVWTDMLQGFVMVAGVVVMLVLALSMTGGLTNVSRTLEQAVPPRLGDVVFARTGVHADTDITIPADTWFTWSDSAGRHYGRLNQPAILLSSDSLSAPVQFVEVSGATGRDHAREQMRVRPIPEGMQPVVTETVAYVHGAGQKGVYVRAPGPSPLDRDGFLPVGLALSFFVFWALSGTGQPGNMIRLMAFKSHRTLKRGIAALSVYFTLIYLPLVVVFVCARLIEPGMDAMPDRIMLVMAFRLTDWAGIPWMAGLLLAAPFAAAMSTVDSFMLMISSSIVRDIYQQSINPSVSERSVKRLSYLCTLLIGTVATIGALNPPQFLQYIIVFSGGGLAVTFLIPVGLGMYWPAFNRTGALAAMMAGFVSYVGLYGVGYVLFGSNQPVYLLGMDPLIWGFSLSLFAGWVGTKMVGSEQSAQVRRFFYLP